MKRVLLRSVVMAALGLFFGGCATIVKDDNQPVAFSTDPQGATVAINGVARGTTPATIMVARSRKKQMVEISKVGYRTEQFALGKHLAGMTFGNIIFGGLIGIGVDIATGKATNYEDSVSVKLAAITPPKDEIAPVAKPEGVPAVEPPKPEPVVAAADTTGN